MLSIDLPPLPGETPWPASVTRPGDLCGVWCDVSRILCVMWCVVLWILWCVVWCIMLTPVPWWPAPPPPPGADNTQCVIVVQVNTVNTVNTVKTGVLLWCVCTGHRAVPGAESPHYGDTPPSINTRTSPRAGGGEVITRKLDWRKCSFLWMDVKCQNIADCFSFHISFAKYLHYKRQGANFADMKFCRTCQY